MHGIRGGNVFGEWSQVPDTSLDLHAKFGGGPSTPDLGPFWSDSAKSRLAAAAGEVQGRPYGGQQMLPWRDKREKHQSSQKTAGSWGMPRSRGPSGQVSSRSRLGSPSKGKAARSSQTPPATATEPHPLHASGPASWTPTTRRLPAATQRAGRMHCSASGGSGGRTHLACPARGRGQCASQRSAARARIDVSPPVWGHGTL